MSFWVFCATMLIIGLTLWVIQLDRKIRDIEERTGGEREE